MLSIQACSHSARIFSKKIKFILLEPQTPELIEIATAVRQQGAIAYLELQKEPLSAQVRSETGPVVFRRILNERPNSELEQKLLPGVAINDLSGKLLQVAVPDLMAFFDIMKKGVGLKPRPEKEDQAVPTQQLTEG